MDWAERVRSAAEAEAEARRRVIHELAWLFEEFNCHNCDIGLQDTDRPPVIDLDEIIYVSKLAFPH